MLTVLPLHHRYDWAIRDAENEVGVLEAGTVILNPVYDMEDAHAHARVQ